jgi:hypothetical protein
VDGCPGRCVIADPPQLAIETAATRRPILIDVLRMAGL